MSESAKFPCSFVDVILIDIWQIFLIDERGQSGGGVGYVIAMIKRRIDDLPFGEFSLLFGFRLRNTLMK
jgi:hypothetical protein